ncbi:19446_t:CDS:1 [Gigaspora margarita]|uniref:19446_t:CDS:1 n=1 Tax=Gigaspora margarita TaxID=4874 RepID=A0ABM8W6N6_GIGMA|nr:19446_t:CDS:1 [Gigaspora margarita]
MPKVSSRSKKSSNVNIPELVTTIKVPFPSDITTEDLLANVAPHDNKPGRTPNAFISYKMALHRELKSQGFNYPIPVISKIASLKWKYEPVHVRNYYTRLADEAKQDYRRSRPFFIMAPGCKDEKETNPQKEGLEVEVDNCNVNTHFDNRIQEPYNDLHFGQQEMNTLNEPFVPFFSNEFSTPLNEHSISLNEYSAPLNEHPISLNEYSAPSNGFFTSLNEPLAPLNETSLSLYEPVTTIPNDFLQLHNFYPARPLYYVIQSLSVNPY